MSYEELIDRAWDAFDEEQYEQVEAYARRALMVDPDSLEARIAVARALLNQEEYEAALPILREAVALMPDDAETRTILGIALFENCEFEEALESLRRAVDLGADTPDVHYWLGLSLERRGNYAAAERNFARASELDPEHYPLPLRISREECLRAVEKARGRLPREYDPYLENVAIHVEDLPSEEILKDSIPPMDPCLLGLFVGVPLKDKSAMGSPPLLPDQVFIFQRNLERSCSSREILVEEIYKTLYHELGHYMGRDEDELAELGMA